MFDHPLIIRLLESLTEQSLTRRRQTGAENLAHELIAEAEAKTVDPQDPTLAQALELLDEFDLVDTKQRREWLRLERLLEYGGGEENTVGPGTLRPALRDERLGERGRQLAASVGRDRLRHKARVAAGRLV